MKKEPYALFALAVATALVCGWMVDKGHHTGLATAVGVISFAFAMVAFGEVMP